VKVDDTVRAVVLGLELHRLADHSEPIADMDLTGGLDAREDTCHGGKLRGPGRGGNMMRDAEALARLAERAAAHAGSWLRDTLPPPAEQWEAKGHHDFVTRVDRTAEAMIGETLLRAEPSSHLMGEEGSPDAVAGPGLVWVVDPLDGTTNFLHRYPAWAVSIAAAIDGEVVAGTVYQPSASRRATAWLGGGTWQGGERLHVSNVTTPSQALIGTGFPFKHPGMLPDYLPQLGRVLAGTSGVRRAGAAALDLLDVASGRFDGFWEMMLAPWDTAAGLLLVREAGGVVTTLDGRDLGVEHSGVIAGNPAIHGWLLSEIGDTR
jgi:myo-inositol-1(or 4)-monophosphatase